MYDLLKHHDLLFCEHTAAHTLSKNKKVGV